MAVSNTSTSVPTPALSPGSRSGKTPKRIADISLLVFVVLCGGWGWFGSAYSHTAWDFTQFYLAGSLPSHSIYDQEAFHESGERLLAPLGVNYYPPYVRPAVFSLPLGALTWLPYWYAYVVFATVQFACYLAAIYLMRRQFGLPVQMLVGFGLFYPAMMGIITGQDSNALALLLAICLVLLAAHKDKAAGTLLALCLYKFNLILLLPVLLLVKQRYEALKWFCGVGVLLAAGSALIAPPGEYLALLQTVSNYTIGFSPDNMIGVRSLAYGLELPWLFYPLAALAAGVSAHAMFRLEMPQAYGVAVVGSLLCSYHANWYDGAVLLIPLAVAFRSSTLLPKLAAAPLLFAFPLWAISSKIIAGLMLFLLAAFVVSPRVERETIPSR